MTQGATTAVTLDIGELYQQVAEYDGANGDATSNKYHYRIFAGGNQIAEIIKTQAADGSIGPATTTYLHQDRLGSAVMATDASGAITSQQWFDPFGAQRAAPDATSSNWDYATANSGFTGHQHDVDLALVNMRGRLFDSRLGRFTKADPFVTEPFNPQGLNRYAYVQNNPLNFVDPSGFEVTYPPPYDIITGPSNPGSDGSHGFDSGAAANAASASAQAGVARANATSGSSGYYRAPGDENTSRAPAAAARQSVADANRALPPNDRAGQNMGAASAEQTQNQEAQQRANAASSEAAANARMSQPARQETPGYIKAASIVGLGVPFLGPLATMHDPNASDDEKGRALIWTLVDAATLGVGVVVRTGGKAAKVGAEVLGRGSTAAIEKGSTLARNLRESLAIKQTMANPSAGRQLPTVMNDARWLAREGWVKMEQVVASGGREGQIVVHYVRNAVSGAIDDFKIILSGAR